MIALSNGDVMNLIRAVRHKMRLAVSQRVGRSFCRRGTISVSRCAPAVFDAATFFSHDHFRDATQREPDSQLQAGWLKMDADRHHDGLAEKGVGAVGIVILRKISGQR